ncbi:MAG: IclR family transcriptional regulator [Sphingobium sp.]
MTVPTPKIVKSAQRVMELLEFFNADQPEATVMDIVRVLNYPQSSASELLRSLVSLGYLSYDRYQRSYRPTVRVPLLGSWVNAPLFRDRALLSVMDSLMRETGETIVLATIDSFALRYIHVVKPHDAAPDVCIGSTRSPFRSALGRAIASQWKEKLVQDIVRRLNAEEADGSQHLRQSEVIADLRNVAVMGHAVMTGELDSNHGIVAINLPDESNVAIGLTCPAHALRQASERAAILVQAFASTPDIRQPGETTRVISGGETPRLNPVERASSIQPIWQSAHYEGRRA